MKDGSSVDETFDHEEHVWSELLRSEMDSWHPSRLPTRFHRRQRAPRVAAWPSFRLGAAAILLVLLLVLAVAGLRQQVSEVIVNLGRLHPATSATPLKDNGSPRGNYRGAPPSSSGPSAVPVPGGVPRTWPSPGAAPSPASPSGAPAAPPTTPPRLPTGTPTPPRLPPLPSPPLPSLPPIPPLPTPSLPV